MRVLADYKDIVGYGYISNIYRKAKELYGRHILHINSTYQGGGVAEMLSSLVPLMNDVGIDAGWRTLHGYPDFFGITKKFHNALQGGCINLTKMKKRIYNQVNENFSVYTHIGHDCVIIHDPQPLPLIKFFRKRQPWLWRCHVDLSAPDTALWEFFKEFLVRYDVIIISNKKYQRQDLPMPQRVIFPAIDPLSPKNMEISGATISKYVRKAGVPLDKPLLTQISRFDKWKDPEGLVEVFKLVKGKVDCRLVLCGSMASDDPEGGTVYERVKRKAKRFLENKDIILITREDSILVNALQRFSTVVVQKSAREGFGLTVTEALWKGKPVVASNVGGIPLQIVDGENGFLAATNDAQDFANKIIHILQNPGLAQEMGEKARETVREHFLITRLLSDYLDLLNK